MTSIRARTATLVALSTTALLIVGGLALLLVLRRSLTDQFDDGLAARAAALQSLTHFDGTKVELDFAGETMPRYTRVAHPEFFIAWVHESAGWRVLERSESLPTDAWPDTGLRDAPPGIRDLSLPAGIAGRGLLVEFRAASELDEEHEPAAPEHTATTEPSAGPQVRLLVALSRAPLDRTLSLIAWGIAAVGGILALASIAASCWAVSRGLLPLRTLSRRVQALGPETLGTRLGSPNLPPELRPIAEQLDALLARLHEAFDRERRFSAAASHELRTPIAELRTLLDVAASRPRSSTEWSATAATGIGVLARAQSLCESLLRLSRAETIGAGARPQAAIELAPFLADIAARTESLRAGGPRLEVCCPSGLVAHCDPAMLSSILVNLLENALRHSPAAATIPILVSRSDDRISIDITNPAPALEHDDLPRLFEPFWRKDESRTDQSGFGLGLAVARTFACALGGDLSADLIPPGMLRMRLQLPL